MGIGLGNIYGDPNQQFGLGNIYGDPNQTPSVGDFGIPSTVLGSGLPPSGGGSFIQNLMGGQNGLADISKVLGGFSSGQKANRALEGQFTQNYDRLMMEAQQARNQNESDALNKLGQTSYLLQGGSHFKPPTLSLNGKNYNSPDLGFGPIAPSEAEKSGASALQAQMLGRLSPGGSYTPTPLNNYAKPGLAENLSSYGGAATGMLGAIPGLATKVGGLLGLGGGGAAAAGSAGASAAGTAGAAASGGLGSTLAGLATNPWTLGIAGAIGGGLLLKKLMGGPSREEKDGRGIESQFENSYGGFEGMMNAIGQGYLANGHTAQEAQIDAKRMLDAEKQGGPAVQSAIATIMSKMGNR